MGLTNFFWPAQGEIQTFAYRSSEVHIMNINAPFPATRRLELYPQLRNSC